MLHRIIINGSGGWEIPTAYIERVGCMFVMTEMFSFRIIDLPDGNQVIDTGLSTPYEELTLLQMIEYTEMEGQIALMERMRERERTEMQKRQKLARNPIYKLACLCGLV